MFSVGPCTLQVKLIFELLFVGCTISTRVWVGEMIATPLVKSNLLHGFFRNS